MDIMVVLNKVMELLGIIDYMIESYLRAFCRGTRGEYGKRRFH